MSSKPMTLREAAERTSRSITTLRRYIRSGRLHAEKRHGRFGPEYYVSAAELVQAGLEPGTLAEGLSERSTAIAPRTDSAGPPAPAPRRSATPVAEGGVPLTLFQELQMKHEQLLVQYGMVRAGGLRMLELQADLDEQKSLLEERDRKIAALRREAARETEELDQQLRQARLELEARGLELGVLREKVRALEMLTRNAVTSESIEKQYRDVMLQARRVGDLTGSEWTEARPQAEAPADKDRDQHLDH